MEFDEAHSGGVYLSLLLKNAAEVDIPIRLMFENHQAESKLSKDTRTKTLED